MDQKPLITVDGPINTSFGQMYLASGDYVGEEHYSSAFAGQTNGMCGGAVEGGLVFRIGIHTGDVPISVHVYETMPPIDDTWEEIVEAPCVLVEAPIKLYGCGGESSVKIPMSPGRYRARFCARGLGDLGAMDTAGETSESYLLILWADEERQDEIIKQTSERAALRHEKVQPSMAP